VYPVSAFKEEKTVERRRRGREFFDDICEVRHAACLAGIAHKSRSMLAQLQKNHAQTRTIGVIVLVEQR